MNRDGVDRMFPFVKRDSEWGSKHEPKKYLLGGGGGGCGGSYKVCKQLPCLPSTQK